MKTAAIMVSVFYVR